jgi:NADH dehydrogenase, FAD-containing subunit
MEKKHIVVVGGGFAGLNFAKKIGRNNYFDVTIIDKNNYNYFTPLLYQVATGFLDPASISYPFRMLFRETGIRFRMGEVQSVNTARRIIELNDGAISYDHLVFAAGAKTNYFGDPTMGRKTLSLKGIDDGIYMRNELIRKLESAAKEKDPSERKKLLTFVVVGGGATGVEVAGVLAEMKKYIVGKDYPELKGTEGVIYVIDGQKTLLAPMSRKSQTAAYKTLHRLGVKIKLNTFVSSYEDDQIIFSDGQSIETKTVIWCAGVTAHLFAGIPIECLGRGNRMKTDEYNQVIGLENVYAIGDISIQETDINYPQGHPQLAQPAIQQGKRLAENFRAIARSKPKKPFKYFDKGDMAIIGRNYAVADLLKHKLHLGGLLGLLSWLFIHVVSLVNYNNKIKTLYSWLVAYITRDQHLRMIFNAPETKNVQQADSKVEHEEVL